MGHRARVLVTRPEPGATQTAARLAAMGFAAIKLPLQETAQLPVAPRLAPGDAAAVALPSASAVRHAPAGLLRELSGLPCFAVGEATARAAREAGLGNVLVAEGDAESLAEMILASRPVGAVAYLCGRVRRSVFESRLAEAGIPAIVIETYDTLALDPDADGTTGLMRADAIDAALVYSANAAARLASLVAEPQISGRCEDTAFICISERVAQELGELAGAGRKILVAEEPNETALLKMLGAVVRPAS